MKLVAAIAIADPDLSLREIAVQLDQMHQHRRVVAGNGSRLQSERWWTRRAASGSYTYEYWL